MARDTRGQKDFSSRTQDTARWARDQIKRQSGKFNYKGFFAETLKQRLQAHVVDQLASSIPTTS